MVSRERSDFDQVTGNYYEPLRDGNLKTGEEKELVMEQAA